MENVIRNVETLEKLASDYFKTTNKQDISLHVMQFIRSFEYSEGTWDEIGGVPDAEFKKYVKQYGVYTYFEKLQCVTDIHAEVLLDFKHFIFTLQSHYYTTSKLGAADIMTTIQAAGVGEKAIDTLAGWGGDMQTLIRTNLIPALGTDVTYEEAYKYVRKSLLDKSKESSTFAYQDLIADIDAEAMVGRITSNKSISEALKEYYVDTPETGANIRFSLFKENLLDDVNNPYVNDQKGAAVSYVRGYTKLKWNDLVTWPLYSGQKDNPSPNITNAVANAAANAFVDLIWEKAASE